MPVPSDSEPAVITSDSSNCPVQINLGFVDSALTYGGGNSSETDNSAIITVRENELLPKNKLKGLRLVSLNPIQAGLFWQNMGWRGHIVPSPPV